VNSLAKLATDACGGLKRWKQFETVSAQLVQGSVLWPVKGQAGFLDDTNATVVLRSEWVSHSPFGVRGRRSRFALGRVAIETVDGTVLEELREPRKSFAGHTLETRWTDLQLAYFAGCAMYGHTLTCLSCCTGRASLAKSFRLGVRNDKAGDAWRFAVPIASLPTVPGKISISESKKLHTSNYP
jgi:hypothetical protein